MVYKHLSYDERLAIATYYAQGKKIGEIAKLLQRHYTTIKREIERNRTMTKRYNPVKAQKAYRKRMTSKKCASKLNDRLADKIELKLVETYSPQQIHHYYKDIENDDMISTSTIYRWIKRGFVTINGKYAIQCLREKGKKRQKRLLKTKHIKDGKNIKDRPKQANNRLEQGHFEVDTIVSPKGKTGVIVTATDRYSRLLKAKVVKDRTAEAVSQALIDMLSNELCYTITCDNGREFAYFDKLEKKLDCQVYFANPYASYERGTNEYHNKLLREFFPKGTNFSRVTQDKVDKAVELINNRPCRMHQWKSRLCMHKKIE